MIELKKDTPDTIDCKVYPMSQKEDEALKEFLMKQLGERIHKTFKIPVRLFFLFHFQEGQKATSCSGLSMH